MPLAEVLTAVRQLLLDEERPGGAIEQRRDQLRERFPALTDGEVDDLAAISPERIRVYTRLIFNGELSMLRWIFPISLAAVVWLSRAAGDERKRREIEFGLVRDLHCRRPWHSSSSRMLARNFESYVNECRSDLTDAWVGLPEIVAYERIDVHVFYALDFGQPIMPGELDSLSVEALMATQVVMPPYATLRRFGIDAITLAEHWRTNNRLPESFPSAEPTTAICAREPASLMPMWLRLVEPAEAALRTLEPGQTAAIEQLAAAYLAAARGFESEQAAFADFYGQLSGWIQCGALVRPN